MYYYIQDADKTKEKINAVIEKLKDDKKNAAMEELLREKVENKKEIEQLKKEISSVSGLSYIFAFRHQ